MLVVALPENVIRITFCLWKNEGMTQTTVALAIYLCVLLFAVFTLGLTGETLFVAVICTSLVGFFIFPTSRT
jgi:hypothetical protein